MKKKFVPVIALILALLIGVSQAASYTLPQKMVNQLIIGSGLKGTLLLTTEGERFRTPFLKAVSDAEWSLRGICSGKDFHYYLFQSDEQEQQTGRNELYRKDDICYFRSDNVQGKILAFPTLSQFLDAIFPASGENGSSSSFVSRILSLSDAEKTDQWEPLLNRYQNELEMWLAKFTVTAETVRMETGFSALDFTYEIPKDPLIEQIINLMGEVTSDQDAFELLQSVMTEEEREIYLNPNLFYFYREALNALVLDQPVRMNKRVSAMGDLLRFRLELPLDERTTGCESLVIETVDQMTCCTLTKKDLIFQLAMPDTRMFQENEYEQSLWFAYISSNPAENGNELNRAVRVDVKKTQEVYEEDEKTHETDHYSIAIQQDTTYLPQETDLSLLPEWIPVTIEADLHFSSKYAQNSATTLELNADILQGDSAMKISGKLRTSSPWLFVPFEIIDPIQVGTDPNQVLAPYLTDWISNAASIIHYTSEPAESISPSVDDEADAETQNSDEDNPEAEAMPLDVTE